MSDETQNTEAQGAATPAEVVEETTPENTGAAVEGGDQETA